MLESSSIPDFHVRRLAESNFDQNVVVVAGAGTGKTTLLVNRLLTTLFREPDPIPITKIVALTFTNKAAAEVKARLQEQLFTLIDWTPRQQLQAAGGSLSLSELQERFQLSASQIVDRAQRALNEIEKAQIGTLHSFAAHLLRLHPLESGVPPNFREDDDSRFEEYFRQEWNLWSDHELSLHGEQHDQWRTLLSNFKLEQIRGLALDLCRETSSVDTFVQQADLTDIPENLRAWCENKRERVVALRAVYDSPKPRKIETMLGVVQEVLEHMLTEGLTEEIARDVVAKTPVLFSTISRAPSGWSEEHFAEARELIRIGRALCSVNPQLIHVLLLVLIPFLKNVQHGFVNEGWVTFHGLLTRARSLLRDYPIVRDGLKQEYQAILVDEFQDTDPIQYEIILYLCEEHGQSASNWTGVRLAPGKLFIVGDPKQSIYAFRGADLEAFDYVVQKIQDSGGVVYELLTNFRSHHRVLEVINEVFNRLFQPQKHVQPSNIPLAVRPGRHGGLQHSGVELHLVNTDDFPTESDTQAVSRLEADQLARWIKTQVLDCEGWTEEQGQRRPFRPGHIGLLFRKLTQAQVYLEALQRQGIPYVTDGERHFYRRQEIIDFVNVLRVIENPRDSPAMLGVLRSSLGGLNDQDIYELAQCEAFDCRECERIKPWKNLKAPAILRLYETFTDLHETAFLYPLVKVVDRIFSCLPILELAAASMHGEQAVANLMKVRILAAELADRPHMTITGFVNLLVERLEQKPSEAERALEEESLDAVRILTIHKAKGLEFPVVILPGCHHGAQAGYESSSVTYDWATGVMGVSIGGSSTLSAVMTHEKKRVKEEAEQRRLLYVAMTRAKERLILSGGFPSRLASGSFLDLLQNVVDSDIENSHGEDISIGPISFRQTTVHPSDRRSTKWSRASHTLKSPKDLTPWLDCWEERGKTWELLKASSTYLTPTSQKSQKAQTHKSSTLNDSLGQQGALIGTLIHRILEGWNFTDSLDRLKDKIEKACEHGIPSEYVEEGSMIREEVNKIIQKFLSSEIYATLKQATVLGREIPFTVPWDCERNHAQGITSRSCVMEGVIDLVYQIDRQIWLADYKTDDVKEKDMPARSAYYQEQTAIYRHAAQRCLGLDQVKCQLLFLRLGKSIQV